MPPVRGRRVRRNKVLIKEAIIRRKSEIVSEKKLISKSMDVWKKIASEVSLILSALYAYVAGN